MTALFKVAATLLLGGTVVGWIAGSALAGLLTGAALLAGIIIFLGD